MDNPPSDDGAWDVEEEGQQAGQGHAGTAAASRLASDMTQTLVKNYLMLTAAMEQQNLGRFQGMLGYLERLHMDLLAVDDELHSAEELSIAKSQAPAAAAHAASNGMGDWTEQAAQAAAQARQQQEQEEQQERQALQARQRTAAAMRHLKCVQDAWWYQQQHEAELPPPMQLLQQQQAPQQQQLINQAGAQSAAAPTQPLQAASAAPRSAQQQAAAVLALGTQHPTTPHGQQPTGSAVPVPAQLTNIAAAAAAPSALTMQAELLPGVDQPASDLLVPLGLAAYVPIMEQHQVDMAALRLLNDQQLLQLGLPLGAVVKIRAGLARLDSSVQ